MKLCLLFHLATHFLTTLRSRLRGTASSYLQCCPAAGLLERVTSQIATQSMSCQSADSGFLLCSAFFLAIDTRNSNFVRSPRQTSAKTARCMHRLSLASRLARLLWMSLSCLFGLHFYLRFCIHPLAESGFNPFLVCYTGHLRFQRISEFVNGMNYPSQSILCFV